MNPFFQASALPFHLPPFDKIHDADYLPAFERGMAEQRKEVYAIAKDPHAPTFRRAMSTNYGYEYWSQRADGTIVLGGGRWAVPDRDEGYYAEEVNPAIQSANAVSQKGIARGRRGAEGGHGSCSAFVLASLRCRRPHRGIRPFGPSDQ